jgi:hypothetical protein
MDTKTLDTKTLDTKTDVASPNAYAQWASFTIKAVGFPGVIDYSRLQWGKFYQWDNKDHEVSVNGIKFAEGRTSLNLVSACGREDSPSGTQGEFYICKDGADPKGPDYKVCKLSWDCPWAGKINSWGASDYDSDMYVVSITGGSSFGGAIGTLTVTVAKIG